jgi:hypothetical protein
MNTSHISFQLKIRIAVILVVLAATTFFLWRYINAYLTGTRASVSAISIGLGRTKTTVSQNEEFNINVSLTPSGATTGDRVSAADVRVTFNPNNQDLIDYVPMTGIAQVPVGYFDDKVIETVSTINGTKVVQLVVTAKKTDAQLAGLPGSMYLSFKFRAKRAGTAVISVDSPTSEITGVTATTGGTGTSITYQLPITNSSTSVLITQNGYCTTTTMCGTNGVCTNSACTCAVGKYNCDGTWSNGCESSTVCPGSITVTNPPTSSLTRTPTPTGPIPTPITGVFTFTLTCGGGKFSWNATTNNQYLGKPVKLFVNATNVLNTTSWPGSTSSSGVTGPGFTFEEGKSYIFKGEVWNGTTLLVRDQKLLLCGTIIVPTSTRTPTPTLTKTPTPRPPTLTPTLTPKPPTATPTKSIVVPTATRTPTPTLVGRVTFTPVPPTKPATSVSPTGILACPKSKGDADCRLVNGAYTIDDRDFQIWRCEFLNGGVCSDRALIPLPTPTTSKSADFNANGIVDGLDFEIWRFNANLAGSK